MILNKMKIELPKTLQQKDCTDPNIKITHTPNKQVQSIEPLPMDQLTPILSANLPMTQTRCYPPSLVRIFLLIKINSLCKPQANVPTKFVQQLIKYFNQDPMIDILVSLDEQQILSQIIMKIQGENHLSHNDVENVLEGNAFLGAICVWIVNKGRNFLKKEEIAFTLSFTALGGREKAFTPIVHKEKNHKGQAQYAQKIYEFIKIRDLSTSGIEELKVQDPYSMRCSPHVHGVAYDSLHYLQKNLSSILNRTHCKYLTFKGKRVPNLLQQSDTYSLKLDYVILSLQEIGAMSFLRSERILNKYLGKNKIDQSSPAYVSLNMMMKSAINLTARNKVLSEMGNFDTMNISNYIEDIYFSQGNYFQKCNQLIDNLYNVMTLQILSSIQALKSLYQQNVGKIFMNEELQKNFNFLKNQCCPIEKRKALLTIQNLWMGSQSFV